MFATVDIVGIMIKDKVDADKPEDIMYYIKHVLQYLKFTLRPCSLLDLEKCRSTKSQ